MSNFFNIDRRFLGEEVNDSGLTRIVMDAIVYFLTRFGFALRRDCFVFVLRHFLIDRLGGGIDLTRQRICRLIRAYTIGDEGGFRIIAIGLYAFMLYDDRPIKVANLAMFLDGVCRIDAAFSDVMSAINRDFHLDYVYHVCLGLARLGEVNDHDLNCGFR